MAKKVGQACSLKNNKITESNWLMTSSAAIKQRQPLETIIIHGLQADYKYVNVKKKKTE